MASNSKVKKGKDKSQIKTELKDEQSDKESDNEIDEDLDMTKILSHLITNGFHAESLDSYVGSSAEIKNFFKIVKYTEKKTRARSRKIPYWKANYNLLNHCDEAEDYHPAAVIFAAISEQEDHPKLEDSGGIDFAALYRFISLGLCGLPQEGLNKPTAMYLNSVFNDLLINSQNLKPDKKKEVLKLIEATENDIQK